MDCPFCQLPDDRLLAANELAVAILDGFPVSPGHTLVIPRRHVSSWFDASREEREALLTLVDEVKARLDEGEPRPAGYNVGINVGEAAGQTVMHLHVHLIPRFDGDVDDPRGGVRFVVPERGNYRRPGHVPLAAGGALDTTLLEPRPGALSTGGFVDPFEEHLIPLFERARDIAVVAAFVRNSGVRLVEPRLTSALERGARVRLLTGDYLEITQARALRHLLDLAQGDAVRRAVDQGAVGALELRVVEAKHAGDLGTTFHPKAWLFPDLGTAFVGSSNLTRAALRDGVEWNARLERSMDAEGFARVIQAFERLWERGRVVDAEWVEGYEGRAREAGLDLPVAEVDGEDADRRPSLPHGGRTGIAGPTRSTGPPRTRP